LLRVRFQLRQDHLFKAEETDICGMVAGCCYRSVREFGLWFRFPADLTLTIPQQLDVFGIVLVIFLGRCCGVGNGCSFRNWGIGGRCEVFETFIFGE
jgi:hypothetical protein